MNNIKVGIASYDAIKARTIAIARGKTKKKAGEPKIWFHSLKSFASVFSEENQALLKAIAEHHHESIAELERLTGRKASNLSRTLKTMSNYGLVQLSSGKSKGGKSPVKPKVLVSRIDLQIDLAA